MSVHALYEAHQSNVKSTYNRWDNYHNRIEEIAHEIEADPKMNELDEITASLLSNKSEIMGRLAKEIIELKYAHLLKQDSCSCNKCKKELPVWSMRRRTIETKVGTFELARPYFYCRACNAGHYPLDEALCLSDSRKQYDIQQAEAYLSSEMPYHSAQEAYERITGDTLSAHHLHDTTNVIGQEIDLETACPSKRDVHEKIEKISEGQRNRPILMLGIDGAHGPMRPEPTPHPRKGGRGKGEWKEIKGFRLYLLEKDKVHHLVSWHQVCTDKELAKDLQTLQALGLFPEDKVRLGIIGDGAPWIWNRCKELFPSAKEILDYYHCSEHVHEVANEHYGKGTRQAQEWAESTLTRIFYGKTRDVISGLRHMLPKTDEEKEKINKLCNYLLEHENRTPYGSTRRAGYHIGSGAIESSNKFICNTRLKRSGAWWYIELANNMLKIRCAKYNGTYDKIFSKYKKADQERIRNKRLNSNLRIIK